MTSQQLIMLITPILNEVLERTLNDLKNWILRFVPKRTGQLRNALLRNMTKSKVQGNVLNFIIGTNFKYAERVNQMSTRQVRHASWFEHRGKRKKVKGKRFKRRPKAKRAYAYYYNHHGPIFLDDPEAIGGFWDALLKYLKSRSQLHLKVALKKYYGKQKDLGWVTV